jgi:hypothetical protein
MNEKRQTARHRALKGGSISFSGGAKIDCVIRNLSETGAALEVESPIGIPDDFMLFVNQEETKWSCHVAWRSAKKIGVRFLGSS